MASTLRVPLQITIEVVVHEIDGGGFWGEVPRFPGCLAQAETEDGLRDNILLAVHDWLSESPEKTRADAEGLAAIQGSRELPDTSYPRTYEYLPPASWTDEDE